MFCSNCQLLLGLEIECKKKWKEKLKTKLLSLNFLLVVNNDKNSDQEKILFGKGILKLEK